MESYKDVHPVIVCDSKNTVEVYVKGANKGMKGINRVSIEHYFSTVHEREQKSQRLCKILRNKIEELESQLEDSKTEMEKLKRESIKSVKQVRHFWRNRIFEEASRGGQMLMSSIKHTANSIS